MPNTHAPGFYLVPRWIMHFDQSSTMKPAEKLIFTYMLSLFMLPRPGFRVNRMCFPSQRTIAKSVGVTRQYACLCLRRLVHTHRVVLMHQRRGRVNIYELPVSIWKRIAQSLPDLKGEFKRAIQRLLGFFGSAEDLSTPNRDIQSSLFQQGSGGSAVDTPPPNRARAAPVEDLTPDDEARRLATAAAARFP